MYHFKIDIIRKKHNDMDIRIIKSHNALSPNNPPKPQQWQEKTVHISRSKRLDHKHLYYGRIYALSSSSKGIHEFNQIFYL